MERDPSWFDNEIKSCGINNALDGTEDDLVWDEDEEEEDEEEPSDNEFETDSSDNDDE